jgi:uncharacterized protein YdhG (YjbR/CyaY superfamily)
MKTRHKTVDEYIRSFPEDVQKILEKLRLIIRKTAPGVEETISYGMPTFNIKGKYLIYFAAWKHHIAFYPVPSGTESFTREISPYVKGKGTLQFPLSKPLPYDLVEKIVKTRLREVSAK